VVAAIAGTAAVTYTLTRSETTAPPPPTPASPTPTAQAPQYSAEEQAAAKQAVCKVFDDSTRGQQGQGGLRGPNGEINVAMMLRRLNSVVAVQNALKPATPPEVTAAARKYIRTSLDLTTAATGAASTDDGNQLNDIANTAIFAFADVCGLSH